MTEVTTKRSKVGWTTVAFGDVVRQVKDKVDPDESGLDRYVAGEHMDTDDLRICRWGDIGDGYLGPAFHMRFKPGHVLYGSRRTYLRKAAVADFEGITANTTYVLEPKDPNVLLPELLPFIMQTEAFNQHSVRESKGSVNPYVNFSDLAWYEFALPPIEEQRRLVQGLKAADSLSGALQEVLAAKEASIQSALRALFFQANAPKVALGDVAVRVTNGFVGSAVKHYVDDGVPYLRSLNVRRTGLDLSDLVSISQAFHDQTHKSQLLEHDLLTVQSGHVGETAVVPARCDGWNCHALILTRLDLAKADASYVAMFLNSLIGQQVLARYYVGSTVAHLNTSDLERLQIPLFPLDVQQEIAAQGEVFLQSRQSTRARLGEAQAVKEKLLREVSLSHRGET